MNNAISLIQSKTFWGAFLALLASVAQAFGLSGLQAFAADPAAVTGILNFVSIAGTMFAIFGRVTATAKVVSVLPGKS